VAVRRFDDRPHSGGTARAHVGLEADQPMIPPIVWRFLIELVVLLGGVACGWLVLCGLAVLL